MTSDNDYATEPRALSSQSIKFDSMCVYDIYMYSSQ